MRELNPQPLSLLKPVFNLWSIQPGKCTCECILWCRGGGGANFVHRPLTKRLKLNFVHGPLTKRPNGGVSIGRWKITSVTGFVIWARDWK
jgi:hypothetical protein